MEHHGRVNIQVQTALIGAAAGLVSGAVGSLIAPWVNWRIERKRELHRGRAGRLAEWRAGLAQAKFAADSLDDDRVWLTEPWYLSLRRHIPDDLRRHLEFTPNRVGSIDPGGRMHRPELQMLLNDEIDRIAKEWDLP
jgi:hypothetical protein